MKIHCIDETNKKILIEIPITQHTGKIRIKERNSYTDFGIPVSTKQKPFNQKMYVEWQISYDKELNSQDINLSTLRNEKSMMFIASNGKQKVLYELSEYLYYFHKMDIISKQEIKEIKNFIENIPNNKLIENSYKIYKSIPVYKSINGIKFLESEIKYPHLVHDFNNGFFIIAEITIKEKQKAVGIQPMVYICFPVSCLKDIQGKSIIGRTAKTNEKAIIELTKDKAFVIINSFKIFGMLSESHKYDILQILGKIEAL